MTDTNRTTCPSCGVPWDEHLGIQGTCQRLMEMTERYEVAREGRETAEQRAKEAVQAEMAELRSKRCPRCKEPRQIGVSGPVLFLDIDGVLNDCRYAGIDQAKTEILNSVIYRNVNLKIVISSAWRHELIDGEMTLSGFETMLQACGLRAGGRVIGHTDDDGNDFENDGRANLIRQFARRHSLRQWVAIDDMDLALPSHRFVRTDGDVGITEADAARLIDLFSRKVTP